MTNRQFQNCVSHRDVAILYFDSADGKSNISITLPWESVKHMQESLTEALGDLGRDDLRVPSVLFVGQGPYDLPTLQSSTVAAVGDTVVASIRMLVTPSHHAVVRLPMLPNDAVELAGQLGQRAGEAMEWQKKNP